MFFVFSYSTLLPLAMASAFGNYSSGIKIATEPQVFELPEGTTITLPCALEDHATNVTPRVVWVWSDGKHRSLWNDHHEYHGEDHHGLVKPQVIMEHDSKVCCLTCLTTGGRHAGNCRIIISQSTRQGLRTLARSSAVAPTSATTMITTQSSAGFVIIMTVHRRTTP